MTMCLINRSPCGLVAGNPVCPKCGMDERVVYPGQADREATQERAELSYLRAHMKELEELRTAPPAAEVPRPPPSSKAVGQVFRDAPWAPEMVVLPSGKFLMGSPQGEPGRSEDEGPQREVTIGHGLALGKYPVTFEEWDSCVANGGTRHKPEDQGWGRGRRPVINVSWKDAQQYVAWLNQKLVIAADDPTRYWLPSDARAWTSGDCGDRVLRGGSWGDRPQNLRSADRYRSTPFSRNHNLVGFQLARTVP